MSAYKTCDSCKGQRHPFDLGAIMTKCKTCGGLGRVETASEDDVDTFLVSEKEPVKTVITHKKKGRKPFLAAKTVGAL